MVPKALLRRSLFPAIYVYVPLVVGRTMMLILLRNRFVYCRRCRTQSKNTCPPCPVSCSHSNFLICAWVNTSGLAAQGARGFSQVAADATRTKCLVKNVGVPKLKNGMDYVQLGDSDLIVSKVCSTSVRVL